MRKKIFIVACFLAFAVLGNAFAQDTLVVRSGIGTLNDAISANQGNKIYKLESEGYYVLNAPIENNGFNLVIVGPKYSGTTKPAVIQTGTLADGSVMNEMFSVMGNLTIKNVYLVNASLSGQIAGGILTQKAKSKVDFDNCIIDPIGTDHLIKTNVDSCDIFITNSKLLRSGSTSAINDGPMINLLATFYVDTLYFENNTLVSSGTWFDAAHQNPTVVNFTWINHNTFVFHKSQLDWVSYEMEYYLTNNLFFDFMTSPYLYDWDQYFEPFIPNSHLNLIWADTLEYAGGETKPGDTAGLKFSADSAFTAIAPLCPSWGDSVGNLTLKLYKWNTDYATTVAANPIAEKTFVNFKDNAALMLAFDVQQPGDYLWQLSDATQTVGVWKWTDAPEPVTSYFNGQKVDGQYRFFIQYAGGSVAQFTNGTNQVPVQIKPAVSKHYESLPSSRVQFIEHNLFYDQQMFYDFAQKTLDVDSIPDGYIMPLLWPYPQVITREGPMFADHTNWPYFIYGNTIDNQDPQWNDPQIYVAADSFYKWIVPASFVHWGLHPGTSPDQWPTNWYWDRDGDPGNPQAWPVFDGTYKNPALLTGSIEKLPLGDLNWFPQAKAKWEAKKELISDYIKSLNTEPIDLSQLQLTVWNFDNDTEGWTQGASNNIDGFGWQSGGYIGGNITGPDPFILSPDNLNINITSSKYIHLKMKNGTSSPTGQIYFTTNSEPELSEANHKDFPIIPNDSKYTEYAIDMSDVPGWTGTLKQLRIDPNKDVSSGSFSIDYIKILTVQTAVNDKSLQKPTYFWLAQNYPNPFNPTTTIYYSLGKSEDVTLAVYNVLGQKIRTLVDRRMTAGEHFCQWDGKDNFGRQMSSGIYFYNIKAGSFSKTIKMIMMK